MNHTTAAVLPGPKIPILKPNFKNVKPNKKRKLAEVPGLQLAAVPKDDP